MQTLTYTQHVSHHESEAPTHHLSLSSLPPSLSLSLSASRLATRTSFMHLPDTTRASQQLHLGSSGSFVRSRQIHVRLDPLELNLGLVSFPPRLHHLTNVLRVLGRGESLCFSAALVIAVVHVMQRDGGPRAGSSIQLTRAALKSVRSTLRLSLR